MIQKQQSPSFLVRTALSLGWLEEPAEKLINEVRCSLYHLPTKRIFDLLFSATIMVLFSPIFFLIGLLIALSSKGHVIYSHERIGRGGRPFQCLKFRSMYLDADKRLEELLEKDSLAKDEWERTRKLKNDPRITLFGKFIRKTSLDELPQFWNVLRGDLSVVGPRPVQKAEIKRHFGKNAAEVLSIRPGLTGIWQTSGRSNTTYDERIALDLKYVRERTFSLDLKLIAKTIPAMLFSEGAY